ncbi:MAG: PAS domain S-box protein, partial [Terracidiphilus sp.]
MRTLMLPGDSIVQAHLRLLLAEEPGVLSVSGSVEALLGFTPEAFLSSAVSLASRIHAHDGDIAALLFSPEKANPEGTFNIRLRHADGRIRLIKGHFNQETGPDGQVVLDLLLQDAKSLCRDSHTLAKIPPFRSQMENTEDYLYFKDRNHVFTLASQTLVAHTDGLEHWTDFLGKTDYDVLPEEYADIYYMLEKEVFAGSPVAHAIQETPSKDGKKGWIDNRKYPILDEDGKIVGLWGIARDITEQKQAEEAQRASETQYRTLVESASEGIFVASADFRYVEVNAAGCRMLGYSREELLSLSIPDIVVPEEAPRVTPETARLETSRPTSSDWRFLRKDGTVFLGEVSATVLPDSRFLAIVHDVTERRRVENELRASEASLAAAEARAHMGSWELDLATMSGHWSAETSRLHYRDPSLGSLTFAEFLELVHPEDSDKCQLGFRQVLEAPAPFEFEYRTHPASGPIRLLSITAYMIRDAQGNAVRMEGTTLDVTEQRRAEEALRESEAALRDAQVTAGLGRYVLDALTGNWTSSRELDELFGIDAGYERTVESWMALVHPDDRAMIAACIAESNLGHTGQFDDEYRIIRHNDGELRWVHGISRPEFDGQGRLLKKIGTTQDITRRKLAETELRESKEKLQLFIEHAPASLAMFDREMRYLSVSQRWLDDYGLEGRQIIGACHYDIVPEIPERWREVHQRGLAGEAIRADEDCFTRADGTVEWLRWEVRPWLLADGSVGGIVLFTEDITRSKQAEERLRLASTVFTHAREGILITDAEGAILDVNDAFSLITGYAREELLGRNPRLLSSNLQSREFYEGMWRDLTEKGQWYGEIWNRKKNGELFTALQTITALSDNHGRVTQFLEIFSDITLLKENERKLKHIAHFDLLTGLPNRVLLGDRLHQAMTQSHRRGRMLAVAYLDLDGFKGVNDSHGHEVGDQLLAALASRMKHALREGDTLARLGGDEFVAVLIDLPDLAACLPEMTRLLEAAASAVRCGDLELRVSASLGVTFYPQSEEVDADQLLRQADQAMYQAKLSGRNRYHIFDASLDRTVRGRHEHIEQIRQSLAANEFVLYYQPKVNMATGEFLGAEA